MGLATLHEATQLTQWRDLTVTWRAEAGCQAPWELPTRHALQPALSQVVMVSNSFKAVRVFVVSSYEATKSKKLSVKGDTNVKAKK